MEFVGPIPDGSHVHHECHEPACVNPAHLVIMSASEHARLHNPQCEHGDQDRGTRLCRICDRERKQRERAALTGAAREAYLRSERDRKRKRYGHKPAKRFSAEVAATVSK
jgi:hypothetical protein